MEFDNNNHSVFRLKYHLVLVTSHCRKTIDEENSEAMKLLFNRLAPKYNITLLEWTYASCYLNISFKGHPNSELSKFINAYKSSSSRYQKKRKEGKEAFWNRSFLLSTESISKKDLDCYITSQEGRKEE